MQKILLEDELSEFKSQFEFISVEDFIIVKTKKNEFVYPKYKTIHCRGAIITKKELEFWDKHKTLFNIFDVHNTVCFLEVSAIKPSEENILNFLKK